MDKNIRPIRPTIDPKNEEPKEGFGSVFDFLDKIVDGVENLPAKAQPEEVKDNGTIIDIIDIVDEGEVK